MKKKTFALIGLIVSALLILFGLLTIFGVLGGDTGTPGSAGYLYDSGYATFGADFYNYVSNNAAEAASASRTAASNLDDVATLLKNVCGIFLMGFGLLSGCAFGMIWAGCKAQEAAAAAYPPPFAPPMPFAPAPFAPPAPEAPAVPAVPVQPAEPVSAPAQDQF